MLTRLIARDFAIIESAEIELGPGLTALTGETGAGKSLMVDALLLLAGGRADAGMIRHGAERAEVAAEFDLTGHQKVRARLAELELDDGDECRLRRVLKADGTSRAFVNDRSVTLATLREIAAGLFEIHGQHEHQALLHRARQLAILDAYAGNEALLSELSSASRRWRAANDAIAALDAKAGRGGDTLEFLNFQLEELGRHDLSPAAVAALEDEHRRLAHHGELVAIAARATEALDGDEPHAVRTVLARMLAELERAAELDPRLVATAALVREALVPVEEAAEALARYRDADELDPERVARVERELARLHELARKHRVPIADLHIRAAELARERDEIAAADQRRETLRVEREAALAHWQTSARKLSARRAEAAARLAAAVTALMSELGMSGGHFEIDLTSDFARDPSPSGADEVEFMVSANPGQPPRPLRKVASGGELSRIGLALEVAALGSDDVATMVFDEVDAGIGGAVAEVLGRKLRELGQARQVLCVTHLAQVAAQAHRHFAVRKEVRDGRARTAITALDLSGRRDEIARMLGGLEITDRTRALAGDMLEKAG
jgi:DNA repair protein RecN (Recombination protein N)